MAKPDERQVSLRLPLDVLDRAEVLAPLLARLPTYRPFRLERATVLRLALLRGLAELEREQMAISKSAMAASMIAVGSARLSSATSPEAVPVSGAAQDATGSHGHRPSARRGRRATGEG